VEIALATKRKLGFVQGTTSRPIDDAIQAEMWDTYNCIIIAWIQNSVSESIGESIKGQPGFKKIQNQHRNI